jgi:hypothetical protein
MSSGKTMAFLYGYFFFSGIPGRGVHGVFFRYYQYHSAIGIRRWGMRRMDTWYLDILFGGNVSWEENTFHVCAIIACAYMALLMFPHWNCATTTFPSLLSRVRILVDLATKSKTWIVLPASVIKTQYSKEQETPQRSPKGHVSFGEPHSESHVLNEDRKLTVPNTWSLTCSCGLRKEYWWAVQVSPPLWVARAVFSAELTISHRINSSRTLNLSPKNTQTVLSWVCKMLSWTKFKGRAKAKLGLSGGNRRRWIFRLAQ